MGHGFGGIGRTEKQPIGVFLWSMRQGQKAKRKGRIKKRQKNMVPYKKMVQARKSNRPFLKAGEGDQRPQKGARQMGDE